MMRITNVEGTMRITDIGGKVVNIEGHDTGSDDYPHPLEGIMVIMVTR
jgi:hypothetical protein